MTTAKKKKTWRHTVIGKKGESFGIVEAANADEAIKVATRRGGISEELQQRLVAHGSINGLKMGTWWIL